MHAISCASPSHVKISSDRYDVLCWTVEDGGRPTAWFVERGILTSYNSRRGHMMLLEGTANDGYAEQV